MAFEKAGTFALAAFAGAGNLLKGNGIAVIFLNEPYHFPHTFQLLVIRGNRFAGKVLIEQFKNSEKALFLSERRQRIGKRTVQEIIYKELKLAGIDSAKYSVHKLRHTAATLMYQYGGVDIRALQELLGHESISTTEIYTHVSNEQVRNAVESNPLADL